MNWSIYEKLQYAVVDSDTKKMYVWGIDASSTALQKLSALLTLALPDGLVQPRNIKGYDPVSKVCAYFLFWSFLQLALVSSIVWEKWEKT